MKRYLICAVALTLAACNDGVASRSAESMAEQKMAAGEVALVATAPDGTKLWGIRPPGSSRRVYFASSGHAQTSHSESCGKSCTRTVDDVVPFAEDANAAH